MDCKGDFRWAQPAHNGVLGGESSKGGWDGVDERVRHWHDPFNLLSEGDDPTFLKAAAGLVARGEVDEGLRAVDNVS